MVKLVAYTVVNTNIAPEYYLSQLADLSFTLSANTAAGFIFDNGHVTFIVTGTNLQYSGNHVSGGVIQTFKVEDHFSSAKYLDLTGLTLNVANTLAHPEQLANLFNGADVFIGSAGGDLLGAGKGNDNLKGNGGADKFVFDTALNKTTNVDHIKDFQHLIDDVALSKHIFGNSIAVNANTFYAAAGATAAHDPTDRLVYNKTTGGLYFDRDGKGGAAAIEFAVLDHHPTLGVQDFVIVA